MSVHRFIFDKPISANKTLYYFYFIFICNFMEFFELIFQIFPVFLDKQNYNEITKNYENVYVF